MKPIQTQFEIGNAHDISPDQKIRSWVFDPPYNMGFKYGDMVNDNLDWDEYAEWIKGCAEAMDRHSLPSASMWLIIWPDTAHKLIPIIEQTGWKMHQWLSWIYATNKTTLKGVNLFPRNHRALIWFTNTREGDPEPVADIDAVLQPYRHPNDKRVRRRIAAGGQGTRLYDWWDISIRRNYSFGHRGWFNQLPYDLVKNIILTTSDEGDWVGDLTAGSGTLLEVGRDFQRNCYMNDIDPDALEHWELLKETGKNHNMIGLEEWFG